jgi:hypothetical protein
MAATKQSKQITLFKTDIYKVFDSLNWTFMRECLTARGFSEIWITLIQKLVLQGHSQVILNSVSEKEDTLEERSETG